MRTNLPVTDVEIELSDQYTIVSTTDLQGNITYANPYFIEISGYTSQELIGSPQNILRHPDMPPAACGLRRFMGHRQIRPTLDWHGQKPHTKW